VQAANGLGEPFTWQPEELISIDGSIPLLRQIEKELSQPTRKPNTPKLVIDKKPEGTRSPNLADAIIMAANPVNGLKPIITVARNQFEATPFRIPRTSRRGMRSMSQGKAAMSCGAPGTRTPTSSTSPPNMSAITPKSGSMPRR
jgi:hypothetical protein